MALTDKLVAIADAIRGKTGSTEELSLDQMATEIAAIETGGSSIRYASGTYTPASKSQFMKVTGIGFTPKMFKIMVTDDGYLDGVAKTQGTIYLDGNAVWIGSNSAGTSYTTTLYKDLDTTPQSDNITKVPSHYHGPLETGFFSYGTNKEWMTGYTYEWEAWG